MHFLIFSGGDFTSSPLCQKAIAEADTIIAADSGADSARKNKIIPSVVVGDLDSISKKTKKIFQQKNVAFMLQNTTLVSIPEGHTGPLNASEKDQTDTELAIEYAVQHKATKITVLGGIEGNRIDHVVANVFLATHYAVPIYFLNGDEIAWAATGPTKQTIEGTKGDILSLLPLSQKVEKITTTDLYYPLKNGNLTFGKPRGLSNVLTADNASVSFEKGMLLFVHTIHAGVE